MKRIGILLLCLALALGTLPLSARAEADWVILVHLIGSEQETKSYYATVATAGMLRAETSDRVSFFVQTGGAAQWGVPEMVESDRITHFNIKNGRMIWADDFMPRSMGMQDTLNDFLRWGISGNPAKRYGLILWGQGGVGGVGSDELFENDSLSPTEIELALAGLNTTFEFIGFDAGLMANLQTAEAVRPYARYMIASQEVVPGWGWDYEDLGRYLDENPTADGAAIGRRVADQLLAFAREDGAPDLATLSVIDLQRLAPLSQAMDLAGRQMAEGLNDPAKLRAIARAAQQAEAYGGGSALEGHSNLIDIGSLMAGLGDQLPAAQAVQDALRQAVVYQVKGQARQGAGGLSAYYPFSPRGARDYLDFMRVSGHEGYHDFVAALLYRRLVSPTKALDEDALETALEALPQGEPPIGLQGDAASRLQVEAGAVDEAGRYGLRLTEASRPWLRDARFNLLMEIGEGWTYDLGESAQLAVDPEQGLVTAAFDGEWVALPDGQPLAIYPLSRNAAYGLYTAPVRVDGAQTHLRLLWDQARQAFQVLGIWDGIRVNGAANRRVIPLPPGVTLTPLYLAYDSETLSYQGVQEGQAYVVEADFAPGFLLLPPGDYRYAFSLRDLYGLQTRPEPLRFSIDEGDRIVIKAE